MYKRNCWHKLSKILKINEVDSGVEYLCFCPQCQKRVVIKYPENIVLCEVNR